MESIPQKRESSNSWKTDKTIKYRAKQLFISHLETRGIAIVHLFFIILTNNK
jgi:hypothetical protein